MRLQVEIRESLYEQMKLVAQTKGHSVSRFVRDAIEHAIDPDARWATEEDEFGLSSQVQQVQQVLPPGVQRGVRDLKPRRGRGDGS